MLPAVGIFSTKSMADLQAEAEGGLLRRSLGPARSHDARHRRDHRDRHLRAHRHGGVAEPGPGARAVDGHLGRSAARFSGLCYAELAAMVPVAGSAYTYAYATIGEIFAWIIGWDLILEYALSVSTVAVGWSGYFVSFLADFGSARARPALATPPRRRRLQPAGGAHRASVVAALLVVGIRESAGANTVLVLIKSIVLVVFVVAGASLRAAREPDAVRAAQRRRVRTFGWSGVLRGAGVMFFAYIGFDAVSTAAQEAKNPGRDMPIGILGSLAICTVLYILVAIVLIGIVPYRELNVADPLAVGIDATGLTWLSPVIKIGALFGLFSTMLVNLLGQTRMFYSMSRDGLLPRVFARVHPKFRTPYLSTIVTGAIIAAVAGLTPIARARPARQHRHAPRLRAREHRRDHPAADLAGPAAPLPHAARALGADRGRGRSASRR